MTGKVNNGQLVTVEPVGDHELVPGTVVLCKVKGSQYLHLIKAVQDDRYLIGNNRGGTNGWTQRSSIFGVCTTVED